MTMTPDVIVKKWQKTEKGIKRVNQEDRERQTAKEIKSGMDTRDGSVRTSNSIKWLTQSKERLGEKNN